MAMLRNEQRGRLDGAAAFDALYREHAQPLLLWLTRRTLDPHVALELTAETFATAFRRRRQFRGQTGAEAAAWLYRIAVNEHHQYLRRGRVEQRALRRLGLSAPTYKDDDLARVVELSGLEELRAEVAQEFGELPPAQRDAIRLRVVEDLPYPVVASRLGISEQTARARVSRGLRVLRGAMTNGPEESVA